MSRKLFVGGLSFSVTVEALSDFFVASGFPVSACNLVNDKSTGRPRGFGFVTLEREEDVTLALELDGCQFLGRSIRVSKATSKDSLPPDNGPRREEPQSSQGRPLRRIDVPATTPMVPRNVWVDVASYAKDLKPRLR